MSAAYLWVRHQVFREFERATALQEKEHLGLLHVAPVEREDAQGAAHNGERRLLEREALLARELLMREVELLERHLVVQALQTRDAVVLEEAG